MKHTVTLIPGDGIGPEVAKPTLAIIKAAGVNIEWETHLAGASALKKHKTTIPKSLLDSFTKNKTALRDRLRPPWAKVSRASTWSCARRSTYTRIFGPSRTFPA